MKGIGILALALVGGAAWAQQNQATTAGVTLPLVQAAGGTQGGGGERPGGITHVTRQRSTVGNINLANSFWAAGGVPVVAGAGTVGVGAVSPAAPAVAAVTPPAPRVLDPRALAALRQLAARGDLTAKRVLAAATASGR